VFMKVPFLRLVSAILVLAVLKTLWLTCDRAMMAAAGNLCRSKVAALGHAARHAPLA
jgi:hypothetical protein